MKSKPKIVLWDLETMPILKEAMKVWPRLGNYPGLTLKASITSIICFGYKVLGEDKKARCKSVWDFSRRFKKDVNDDYEVVKFAYEMLKDADCVITQNGKKFDWKHLQTRLLKNKLPTLPKILHVDTKCVTKSNLLLFNNSLDIMGEFLVDEKKLDNGGWPLWVNVMQREIKSMKLMERYCKQDVDLLDKVFQRLRPFVNEIPNFNMFRRDAYPACPNCGGTHLQKFGQRVNKTRIVQRFKCMDCGSWAQETVRDNYPKGI